MKIPGHTCPDIDACIYWIKEVERALEDAQIPDRFYTGRSAWTAGDVRGVLEELRSSNAALRDAAECFKIDAERLQAELAGADALIEEAYRDGFNAGSQEVEAAIESAYQQGGEEAWNAATSHKYRG